MICPPAVGHLARYLAAHPEGVLPMGFPFKDIAQACDEFVELTGEIGDVSGVFGLPHLANFPNTQRMFAFLTS